MRFKGLDLNLLLAFDALLVERNVTRAGERIHLSQSGMSSAVARLREYFDDELLVLVGRELHPTPLAESLAGPVRKILMELESTIVNRPSFDPASDTRSYRLMMSELTEYMLIPHVIRQVAISAPNMSLEIVKMSNNPNEDLERGEIDLVFVPEPFSSKRHPSREVYKEGYNCVVWEANDKIGDTISLAEYRSAAHVAVQFGRNNVPAYDAFSLENLGVRRKIEITTANFMSLPQLVVGTYRIATVHKRLAESMARILPIKLLDMPVEIPPLHQVLQYHSHREKDYGLQWLIQVIVAEAATNLT